MPDQVTMGAMLMCTFGLAPSTLAVMPTNKTMNNCGGTPAANVDDYRPMVNIPPFGMCISMSNPQVASATAAAMGVLTPMPCIPNVVAPWAPGSSTTTIGNRPSLLSTDRCNCMWGGSISIIQAGQMTCQKGA